MRRTQVTGVALLSSAANAGWRLSQTISGVLAGGSRPTPTWAPGPIPRSCERSAPPLGVPRWTQSLCPDCNREAVNAVLSGDISVSDFRVRPGVVDAQIVEEAERVLMRKTCEKHGAFEEVLSTNPSFFRRIESLYVGHDFKCIGDETVHDHGPSRPAPFRAGRQT
jgi:tetraether lipid synthase